MHQMIYEFSYIDNEGDLYESGAYPTLTEVKQAWKEVQIHHDYDCRIEEKWIYDGDRFVGRW